MLAAMISKKSRFSTHVAFARLREYDLTAVHRLSRLTVVLEISEVCVGRDTIDGRT